MTDEQLNEEQEEMSAEDYISQLAKIKEGMVSKEEYAKLAEDNKKLANALTNGLNYEDEEEKEEINVDEIRKSLFSPDTQHKTNLQYFTEVLKLRDGLIERGEGDPFLPFNRDYTPTEQDIARAEGIANQLKECIEYADGDADVFNVELQRRCGIKNKKFK